MSQNTQNTQNTPETTETPETPGAETARFKCLIQLTVYSCLSALDIARHLKLGFWLEDSGEYIPSEKCMPNLFVSRLEIILTSEEVNPADFLIDMEFTFESSQSENSLQAKTVVYFGEDSASLKHPSLDGDIIEATEYQMFELYKEDDE